MPLPMAPALRPFDHNASFAAILVALEVCLCAGSASAAISAPAWLHDAFGGKHTEDGRHADAPSVARYLIDGGGGFIFDRAARQPLLKFDDSPEIWALAPARGPRGDIIYKNDLGEPLLRATRLGGMTVYTTREPNGAAAVLIGPAGALRMASIGPLVLYQRLYQTSIRSTRAAQHLVEFDAPDADASSDGLIADSATVAMEAMVTLSSRPNGKAFLARINKIVFRIGKNPGVAFKAGVITVTLVPPVGIVGRPSSRRILWTVVGGAR